MNSTEMGHDRDLLIQVLSDPEEMGLIRRKLKNIKDLHKIAPAN